METTSAASNDNTPTRTKGWDSRGTGIRRFLRDKPYGADGGGTRRFVACSNAKASSRRRGSLHGIPVKLTPWGAGFAAKFSGNGGVGAFGNKPNGTMTVG